jgi:dienelactone hydrolase
MFAYDKGPLDAVVERVSDPSPDWTKQKVTLNAAYGGERLPAYLFLPTHARPPFQTVIFFPSARVTDLPSSDALGDLSFVDYVIQSGRAVMYPVYKQLYERRSNAGNAYFGPMLNRETVVDWSKDIGRSIDYLATRADIDSSRLGYLGVSQGAADGVILAAIEERFKAIVLLDGGLFQREHPVPGMDQIDFAPRLTRPVLMVNGKYDATFPLETSQIPLFNLLGTPAAGKRRVSFDTPHDVRLRRADLVREVLAWLDTYLGRVQ